MARAWQCAALLCLALAAGVAQGQSAAKQKSELLLLKSSIDPGNKLNWRPGTDVCTQWQGIKCNAQGLVQEIQLMNVQLGGQLPLDAGLWTELRSLQNLNLYNTGLTGFLPKEMSRLTTIQFISLGDNKLEGALPSDWSDLAVLQGLDLSNNNLKGQLPASWGSLRDLQALDLQGNAFTGDIPASWTTGMPALTAVSLANNPSLCPAGGGDVTRPGSNKPSVFYSPCDPTSPTLPGISPNYPVTNSPPMPKPSPSPSPPPESPSPSPVSPPPSPSPSPSPPPSPSPSPSPSPVSPPPSPSPSPSPSPISPPPSPSPSPSPVSPPPSPSPSPSPSPVSPPPSPSPSPSPSPVSPPPSPSPVSPPPSPSPSPVSPPPSPSPSPSPPPSPVVSPPPSPQPSPPPPSPTPPPPAKVSCVPDNGTQPSAYEDVVLTVSSPTKTVADVNSEPLNGEISEILSQITQQCTGFINTTAASGASKRRSLMATNIKITSRVQSNDPAAVQAAVNAAYADGSLAEKLRPLGLDLSDVAFVSGTNVNPSPPPPSDDGGSSLSGGAIAGIAIGGVAAVMAGAGAIVYANKKRKGKEPEPKGKQGELFSVNPAFGEEESPEMRESKRAKSQITSAENPMFGAEGEEGGNVNPMWIAGAQAAGDESPLAPGAVKTRESNAENPLFGGVEEGGDAANPLYGGGDESPVAAGQTYGGGAGTGAKPREFSNVMFRGEGILDSHQDDARAGAGANPLYETNQSQLSAPDSPGAYGDATAAGAAGTSVPGSMMSARSRQESAKEHPAANPIFNADIDSDDDAVDASGAMANPMYQSAHSGPAGSSRAGEDIMGTASSMGDGEYGEPAAGGSAAARGSSGQPFANPLAGGAGEEEDEGAANPLFQGSSGAAGKPSTNIHFRPAGHK